MNSKFLRLILLSFLLVFLLINFSSASSQSSKKLLRSPTLSSAQKSALLNGSSSRKKNRSIGSDVKNRSSYSSTKAIIEMTKALARSHSASEVLTLNLTNLLILIVLKAVIFGIGLFYFGGVSFKGGWKDSFARALENSNGKTPLLNEDEILLMLSYLLGSTTENYNCFHQVACKHPNQAKSYLKVSRILLKGAHFAQDYISYNPKYENVLNGLEEATYDNNSACSWKFPCPEIPHL